MSASEDTGPGVGRLDRWLFAVRLFKTRSAATAALAGGKVHLNGERVKPSQAIKLHDKVTFTRGAVVFDCVVVTVPLRRGPAAEAKLAYEETAASRVRREEFAVRMKTASGLTLRPAERPDKHQRRLLRQLRGRG